jgi:transposase
MNRKFPEIKYLKSIPAIKDIRSAQIVSQVIDPGRFRNKYKFYAYCGLVRYKKQSGGRDYGNKKAHGNRVLKCVYKMAANQVLKGNSALRKYYDKLRTQGVSDKNARNAVSRKIAAVSLSLWINKRRYNDDLLNKELSS